MILRTVPANSDGWTALNGEIMTIRNILVALKDTDIDFDAMGDPARYRPNLIILN
jgi:hypothetical protein